MTEPEGLSRGRPGPLILRRGGRDVSRHNGNTGGVKEGRTFTSGPWVRGVKSEQDNK